MADGIEFTLELLDKLEGATAMVRALEKVQGAAGKTDKELTRLEKTIRYLDKSIGNVGERARDFAQETLGHFAALASFEGLRRVAEGLADIARDALHAASGAQRLKVSFGEMYGEARSDRLLNAGDAIAKITEFDDDFIKGAEQELLGAGMKEGRIVDALMASADIAARTGKPENFGAALSAFKQMQTTGKAPLRLRELGLGEGAGKQIEKEMAGGRKAVDAFLAVLEKAQGKPIGSLAEKMAGTLDSRLKKIANLPDQYFQQLADTPAFDRLTASAGRFIEEFDPDGEKGKRIFGALEQAVTSIVDMIDQIDWASGAQALVDTLGEAVNLTKSVFNVASAFTEKYEQGQNIVRKAVGLAIGYKFETVAEERNREVNESMPKRTPQEEARERGFHAFMQARREAGGRSATGNMYTDAVMLGRQFGLGAATGISESTESKVVPAAVAMGAKAEDATRDRTRTHSPSLVFAEIGGDTADGFAMGIEDGMPAVYSALEKFQPADILPALPELAPLSAAISLPDLPGRDDVAAAATSSAVRGGGAGPGPTLTIGEIVINIGGEALASGDPAAIKEQAGAGVREALTDIIEQMRTGMG